MIEGDRNPDIPAEFLFPNKWDEFTLWILSLDMPVEEDKRLIFDWARMMLVTLTREQLIEYFRRKGSRVP